MAYMLCQLVIHNKNPGFSEDLSQVPSESYESFKFDMVKVVSIKDFLFRFVRKHALFNLGQCGPIFPHK